MVTSDIKSGGGSVACGVPKSRAGNHSALLGRWLFFGARHLPGRAPGREVAVAGSGILNGIIFRPV
jgi:hypothetical protein